MWGIVVGDSGSCNVTGNNCSTNEQSIVLANSPDCTIKFNNLSFSWLTAIVLDVGSGGCLVTNNMLYMNGAYGIYIQSSNNKIWDNIFFANSGATDIFDSSHVQAKDDGSENEWNSSTGGNWWSDWQTPDADSNGIVDNPYLLSGTAGAQDKLPLTSKPTMIPEFGSMPLMVIVFVVAVLLTIGARRRKAD
jgi:parallel beta-helix repeat protein